MQYCMDCGSKLVNKELKKEGMIPYCNTCQQYKFPVFSIAVSMIVMNRSMEKVLLIQQYEKKDFILVAGYVNKGESAENAVIRELTEETGLKALKIKYNRSQYFEPSNTLMLNYTCIVENENLEGITEEIDYAEWFFPDQAIKIIKQNSLAKEFLVKFLKDGKKTEWGYDQDWFVKL